MAGAGALDRAYRVVAALFWVPTHNLLSARLCLRASLYSPRYSVCAVCVCGGGGFEVNSSYVYRTTGVPGIAIDRLDYSEFFNYDYDDNVSWIPRNGTAEDGLHADLTIWGPARALRLSYRHTFNRLHESLHPKAVLAEKEAENAAGKAGATEEALVAKVKAGFVAANGTAEPADKMMLNNCTYFAYPHPTPTPS